MRIAIGASRLYIARQLTVEGLMLAVTGTVFGWMLAAQRSPQRCCGLRRRCLAWTK